VAVVHQILPNLEYGDAISNYAIVLRRVLRATGRESSIYARFIHPRMQPYGRPIKSMRRLQDRDDVIWIYHYSIGSDITRMLRDLAGPILLIYHNITPPLLTVQADSHVASRYFAGWEDLKTITDVPRLAVGSSEYNRSQLHQIGFPSTEFLPIILNYPAFDRPPDRAVLRQFRDGCVNFLTVSRIYPHKKIEDIIKVFRYYHEYINPQSRLFVVGDSAEMDDYRDQLVQLCQHLSLPNVYFTGKVRMRELLAYYALAHVYLCMSEHEGFCVPLLESMYLGVPIIAHKCTAIGETLGDAGVLFREKRFDEIAEMAHLLVTDEDLRTRIINKQKDRALFFQEDYLITQLNRVLAKTIED
jgi:glycosyltransferase involved in cell wall biosynthesis